MKRVLLTGANGYIGKHITLQLLNQGYEVRASVRKLSKSDEVRNAVTPHLIDSNNLNSRLTFVELDLEKDSGWDEALKGIDVLMHTASPFPLVIPANEEELIRPAVDGTIRAFKAVKNAGVKRVILTSSNAAVFGRDLPKGAKEFDETMWTDVNHPIGRAAYRRSKTLAERAAWDFVKNESPEIALTTINPSLVIGSPLDNKFGSSLAMIDQLIEGTRRMLPDLRVGIVDVKDVARMHVDSIKIDATKGERILASTGTRSLVEIAKIIKASNPNIKVITKRAPTWLLKLRAIFKKEQKPGLLLVGRANLISNAKARSLFSFKFIPPEVSIIESAKYLIEKS
jgi:dihydroflavonol-4-reductase